MVLFFAHIPFVVNRAFNATPTERLRHYLRPKTKVFNFMKGVFGVKFGIKVCWMTSRLELDRENRFGPLPIVVIFHC